MGSDLLLHWPRSPQLLTFPRRRQSVLLFKDSILEEQENSKRRVSACAQAEFGFKAKPQMADILKSAFDAGIPFLVFFGSSVRPPPPHMLYVPPLFVLHQARHPAMNPGCVAGCQYKEPLADITFPACAV